MQSQQFSLFSWPTFLQQQFSQLCINVKDKLVMVCSDCTSGTVSVSVSHTHSVCRGLDGIWLTSGIGSLYQGVSEYHGIQRNVWPQIRLYMLDEYLMAAQKKKVLRKFYESPDPPRRSQLWLLTRMSSQTCRPDKSSRLDDLLLWIEVKMMQQNKRRLQNGKMTQCVRRK